MRAPDVSVVIVSWNAGESLLDCCRSLRASAARANVDMQVVVIDNASSDGSLERVSLGKSDVCIRNPVNAGYSVAVAQGMARCEAEWILLLNPDVVVADDFFEHLLGASRRAANAVATVVPEMRFSSRRQLVNCRGLTVDEIGIPAEVDAGRPITASTAPPGTILGGSSGCCLLRVSAVRALGGPEPAFFAYLEDVDLALRLSRAGQDTIFVRDAVAWHEGSGTTGGHSPLKTYLVARNRRLLFRLHGPHTPRARIWRVVVEAGHGLASILRGTRAAPWAGRRDALRLRGYTRFLRRSRRAWDPYVRAVPLSPRIPLRDTLRRKRAIDRSLGH